MKDPRDEKERDYSKQHRNIAGESRHSERRNLPKRRARTHRSYRRGVNQTLGAAKAATDSDEVDLLQTDVANLRLEDFVIWGSTSLGEVLQNRRRYRAAEAGRKYFREPYDAARHLEPFGRFLEAVVGAGVAPSVEMAECLNLA